MATPNFCDHVLDDLGLSGGELFECTLLMPDLYWVRATTMLKESVGAVVTRDGHAVTERGCAAGAAWLRRIQVYGLTIERPVLLVDGLYAVGALPGGFTPVHLTDKTDPQGLSRLTLSPFRLELIADVPPPSGLGAGAPDNGGTRGPGRSPTPKQRAVLTGDADYRFTWTIDRQKGGVWETVSVTPCE